MGVQLESVTVNAFRPFGTVLEFLPGDTSNFYIVDTETEQPWRVAVFRYSNKEITKIECHPTSKESFEPLYGITVLLVAEHDTLDMNSNVFRGSFIPGYLTFFSRGLASNTFLKPSTSLSTNVMIREPFSNAFSNSISVMVLSG